MKTKAPKDIDSYKKHSSDSGFWRKVNRIGKKARQEDVCAVGLTFS
jgi:hypothetical protein